MGSLWPLSNFEPVVPKQLNISEYDRPYCEDHFQKNTVKFRCQLQGYSYTLKYTASYANSE